MGNKFNLEGMSVDDSNNIVTTGDVTAAGITASGNVAVTGSIIASGGVTGKYAVYTEAGALDKSCNIAAVNSSAAPAGFTLTLEDGSALENGHTMRIFANGMDGNIVVGDQSYGNFSTLTFDAENEYADITVIQSSWFVTSATATIG